MAQNVSSERGGRARRTVRARGRVLIGRVRRSSRRGAAALASWASPESNPFLQRALRVEARRNKPLLTLLGVAVLALVLNVVAWKLWLFAHSGVPPLARSYPLPTTLPTALGRTPLGFMMLLTTAALAYAAVWAGSVRAGFLLRNELLKGTLEQLQLLPVAEERWLWMMNAYPAALSLLIALCGLPVYSIAVLMARWSILDAVGLFLVFAMLGHVIPAWQPLQWQQKTAKASAQKFDWKAWRESLKQARSTDPALMTPAQQLEMERRAQRALNNRTMLTDAAGTQDAATVAVNGTMATAGSTGRGNFIGLGASGAPAWMRGIMIWMGFNIFMSSFFGPLGAAWRGLRSALPAEVISLMPAFPLTWPLLLGRLLLAPLPFFSFVMPPALLLVPLWIGLQHQRILALAAGVSASETFWTDRRARRKRTVGSALWLLAALLFFGYGWNVLVVDGSLTGLLRGAPVSAFTVDGALAAGWTLAMVTSTLAAGFALEAPFTRAVHGGLNLRIAWRDAAIIATRSLALAIGMYFAFCWLGGLTGIGRAWTARLLPVIATAGAFLLADFGSGALLTALPEHFRPPWRTVRWLWFWGLAFEALMRVAYNTIRDSTFSFEQAPHVLLSPFVSLPALFRFRLSSSGIAWWWGPLLQAVLGAACLALAGALASQRAKADPATEALGGETAAPDHTFWGRLIDFVLFPIHILSRVWRGFVALMARCLEWMSNVLIRWNEALIYQGARLDNAVLTGELRRRVRKEYWPLQWLLCLVMGTGLFLLAARPWTLLTSPYNGPVTAGGGAVNPYADWGRVVVESGLFLTWLAVGFSTIVMGQSFDRERANGTLVFLFLTPLRDAAILVGKLAGGLLYGAGLLVTALPWLLFGCVAGTAGGDTILPFTAVFGLMVLLSTLLFGVYLQTLFAVRARKPTEGSAKAILCAAPIELAGYILLVVWADRGSWWLCGALLVVALAHLALALLAWRIALWSLHRQRYGDVAVAGKGSS